MHAAAPTGLVDNSQFPSQKSVKVSLQVGGFPCRDGQPRRNGRPVRRCRVTLEWRVRYALSIHLPRISNG